MSLKDFQTVWGSLSISVDMCEPEVNKAGQQISQFIAEVEYWFTAGGYDANPVTGEKELLDNEIGFTKIHVRKEMLLTANRGWREISRCEISNERFFHPDELERIRQAVISDVEQKYAQK